MNHDVFISYSTKNKVAAFDICDIIEQEGVKCWIAPRDIPMGSEYGDIIDKAICYCKIFIVVYSEFSAVSKWVKGEINLAFEEGKYILPYRIDETPLKGAVRVMLNQTHWIDSYPDYKTHFNDMLDSVKRIIRQENKGSDMKSEMIGKNYDMVSSTALIKVKSDLNCVILHYGKEIGKAYSEQYTDIRLPKGEHELVFESIENKSDKYVIEEYNITDTDTIHKISVYLIPEKEKREKKENESKGLFDVNGIIFKMIKIEGGIFQMGSKNAYDDEEPVHNVILTDYYIGETVVTQDLWLAVMGNNPSCFIGDKKPVDSVSWDDCQCFILKLNELTNKNFRLPTEAEWEYAARGGNKSMYNKYSGSDNCEEVAWYKLNSNEHTHDVKAKLPNELGIYDMCGNVWEWCHDWYGDYSDIEQTNPQGPSSGSFKVLRGGCWNRDENLCRLSNRGSRRASTRDDDRGLRLAL